MEPSSTDNLKGKPIEPSGTPRVDALERLDRDTWASVPGETEHRGKAIILVVDRDPHVRELESHFLREAGYSVGFEQDGDGALDRALKNVPDIIVTEILVPGLDGLALCRRLKADPRTRDTAVVIFSVLAAAGRAREAGADAYLQKPLAEHTLVGTVRQLLEARCERIGGMQHER